IDDRVERHLPGLGLEDADAVVDVFAHAWPAAVDARQQVSRRKVDSRRERDQRDKVPAVEWQRYNPFLFDDGADSTAGCFQQWRGGGDLYDLVRVSDRQIEVDFQAIADAQDNAVPPQWREALLCRGELVRAGRHGQELVRSVRSR